MENTQSVYMVLFLNGLPILKLERKNAWTHQTARYHGQKQYRDRDASQRLMQFGRTLAALLERCRQHGCARQLVVVTSGVAERIIPERYSEAKH